MVGHAGASAHAHVGYRFFAERFLLFVVTVRCYLRSLLKVVTFHCYFPFLLSFF